MVHHIISACKSHIYSSLEKADLEPALRDLKGRLTTKNVAEEIADKLCECVAVSLEGKKLASFMHVKKESPLESIAYVTDQMSEIVRLEANKAKLKERVEAEERRNTILKEDLVSKKRALEMRRVALLEEVLKNGVEVKLQRNALSALEPPNGHELDDEYEFDISSSGSDVNQFHEFSKLNKPKVQYTRSWGPSSLLKSGSRNACRETQSSMRVCYLVS